ncbi:hypothetical protein F511_38509 [Dorcoceras hygrometricum]|uniref:Uncharacterized protein n=1 Tax=Dorcoceras hygrometricum TaxID=472368 RepID=A0A2Z7B3P5_9LAMI|nr:hypothetical protein F511_38509 [Dorcoceras hygrometricum]
MGNGIDQLNLHSVQPSYLEILQMGNTDPRHKSRKTNTRSSLRLSKKRIARPVHQLANQIKPLYHAQPIRRWKSSGPISPSQLGGRHSNPVVTTPMIALDFSGTTHQSASHNVAPNQITQSTAELTADATSFHLVQKFTAAGFLELKSVQELKSTRNAHPKSHASRRFTDLTARRHSTSRSSSNADSGSLMMANERAMLGESSATKIQKQRLETTGIGCGKLR